MPSPQRSALLTCCSRTGLADGLCHGVERHVPPRRHVALDSHSSEPSAHCRSARLSRAEWLTPRAPKFGWLISWGYLRFFKVNDNGTRGDRSETFSLVQWFPPFMQYVCEERS
jgi:hypothetical protein